MIELFQTIAHTVAKYGRATVPTALLVAAAATTPFNVTEMCARFAAALPCSFYLDDQRAEFVMLEHVETDAATFAAAQLILRALELAPCPLPPRRPCVCPRLCDARVSCCYL